jgi:glycerol uptake facilitator protein
VALIFALIDERNTSPRANMAPFLIGVLIIAIGEAFGSNSGWAINPARHLGPRRFDYLAGRSTPFKAALGFGLLLGADRRAIDRRGTRRVRP